MHILKQLFKIFMLSLVSMSICMVFFANAGPICYFIGGMTGIAVGHMSDRLEE